MSKMITVIEFPAFTNQAEKCLNNNEKDELIDFLARQPNIGDEIPETGGVRKLRWAGKGKGKRAGLRIIYYFYNDSSPLFLLTIYGKGEQIDLTPEQKIKIRKLAAILKSECKARNSRYGETKYR